MSCFKNLKHLQQDLTNAHKIIDEINTDRRAINAKLNHMTSVVAALQARGLIDATWKQAIEIHSEPGMTKPLQAPGSAEPNWCFTYGLLGAVVVYTMIGFNRLMAISIDAGIP